MNRAWAMWALGVASYFVAVFHRTSFGVAGLYAADRFMVSAATLSSFVVVQLAVYAALQPVVGVLLDRFGARTLIATGAALMAVGQLTLALAPTLAWGLTGRVLVGAGDALTFICVLRLVAAWFGNRRAALLTQLTGLCGQLGQVLSAAPLAALLVHQGWQRAFTAAAALGFLMAILGAALIRNAPPGVNVRTARIRPLGNLTTLWRIPGVRLGFWTHFVTMFSNVAFVTMWGFPYLTVGQGRSLGYASAMLTLIVVSSAASSPLVGAFVGRFPEARTAMVFGVVLATVSAWTAVLAWPTTPPTLLVILLVLALASGGPGSMLGFDFARTSSPPDKLGSATGLVNIGGYLSSIITIISVGLILDLADDVDPTTAFRLALLAQFPLLAVGGFGVWYARRQDKRAHGRSERRVPGPNVMRSAS